MVTVKGLTTLGAALAVCIALGAATMWAAPGSRPPHRAAVHRSGEFGFGAALPCGEGQSPIYFVAQLSDGSSGGQLTRAGLRITLMAQSRLSSARAGGAAAPSSPVALIGPRTAAGAPVSARTLASMPGVQAASAVFPQSSDPALQSCDNQLSDRPADRALVVAARKAIADAGLIAVSRIEAQDTTYLVSDDPLDAGQEIVTIYARGPLVPVAGGAAQAYQQLPYVAFVARSDDRAAWVGPAPS